MTPDLFGGWPSLPGDCLPVAFSPHAVERFGERCRPGLTPDEVRIQLCHMLASARVTRTAPDWIRANGAAAYLLLGADLVMPLFDRAGELVAATALTPRNVGPDLRENPARVAAADTSVEGEKRSDPRKASRARRGGRLLAGLDPELRRPLAV